MHGVIGFAPGVFDLFHVGHLDVLRRSARLCDRLVVGVWSDELAERVHGTRPVVPQLERMEIVANVRHVDDVVRTEVLRMELLVDDLALLARADEGELLRPTRLRLRPRPLPTELFRTKS